VLPRESHGSYQAKNLRLLQGCAMVQRAGQIGDVRSEFGDKDSGEATGSNLGLQSGLFKL